MSADRGQKQGASYLPGLQNNPQKKYVRPFAPADYRGLPHRSALRAKPKPNHYRAAARGSDCRWLMRRKDCAMRQDADLIKVAAGK